MHALCLVALSCLSADAQYLRPASLDLELSAPVASWDEGIPLGNGLLGGLLWGEGSTLRLSLDRGDLWDQRRPEIMASTDWTWSVVRKLVAEGNQAEIERLFYEPYFVPYPTKLGAGRLEVDLGESRAAKVFALHLATAEGGARLSDGTAARCFFSADEPVALLFIPGPGPVAMRLLPPAAVSGLGYPPAATRETRSSAWYVQEAPEGLTYVGLAAGRRLRSGTLIAVTVTTTADDPDPLGLARERTRSALRRGYDALLEPHVEWWAEFWGKSRVDVPDPAILKQYYLARYFHGAASRRGCPPMPLQGVWTADAGKLPPWKGDYHQDLNTEMTYRAYLTAGHFDEGCAFLDLLWNLLPRFREYARDFYGAPGAAVPGVMGLAGDPLGGSPQFCLHPTHGAWMGWMFYQHWLHTRDESFLRERAYPWCSEVAECLLTLLEPGADGGLRLPLSSSPEVGGKSLRAWLEPNSSYDHACMEALFLGLSDMARSLGRKADSERWAAAAEALGPYSTEPATGALMYAVGDEVRQSHRHLSHSMAIYPFGLINIDGSGEELRTIAATRARYDELGTGAWCGYSFSWMACLRARVGDGEAALRNLRIFSDAFVLRNGFHANGDQSGKGYSNFTYRPFTLEGNFLACQAVHEMLLQSWAPRPGSGEPGTIRVFPAMPWSWHDASFDDLRAEGGHRVSARRENNATTWVRVVAGSDGEVRIRDNFGGRTPAWSREGVRRDGSDFVIDLCKGEVLEARMRRPASATIPSGGPD